MVLAQGLFRGQGKNGKNKKGKAFTLHPCWKELEHEEKWKNQELYEVSNRKNTKSSVGDGTIVDHDDDADDASSGEE